MSKNDIIDAESCQLRGKQFVVRAPAVTVSVPHRYSIIDADGLQTERYERQTKQHPCEEVIFA